MNAQTQTEEITKTDNEVAVTVDKYGEVTGETYPLTFSRGGFNEETEVTATSEGLEVDFALVPWAWILRQHSAVTKHLAL